MILFNTISPESNSLIVFMQLNDIVASLQLQHAYIINILFMNSFQIKAQKRLLLENNNNKLNINPNYL